MFTILIQYYTKIALGQPIDSLIEDDSRCGKYGALELYGVIHHQATNADLPASSKIDFGVFYY